MFFLLLFSMCCLVGGYGCENLSNKNCSSQLDGLKEMVAHLLEHATDLDAPIENDETILMVAVRHGLVSLVKDILEQNVTMSIKNDQNYTALIIADSIRHHQIANILRTHAYPDLNCPKDIEIWDINNAAGKGDLENLVLLLSCGVNPNQRDSNSDTVLMETIINTSPTRLNLTMPIITLLLKYNAMLDLQDRNGRTALFLVADMYWQDSNEQDLSHEIARKLLEYNPQVDIQDKYGNTALQYAAFKGHSTFVKILLDHEQLTLNKTFSLISSINEEGSTALMVAASKGWVKVVKVLVEYSGQDAILDTQDKNGRTAMMLAADNYEFHDISPEKPLSQSDNEETVRILLEAGANPDLQDKEGKTALIYAVTYNGFMQWSSQENITGKEEMVRMLLRNGASTKIKDKAGKTALNYAQELGKTGERVVAILYKHTTDQLFAPIREMIEKNG